MQQKVAETIVVSNIDRRARMQQIGQQHIGRELLGWSDGSARIIGAAEISLHVNEIRIRDRRVVVQNQT